MPNILVKVPKNAFLGETRANLIQQINLAAASAELTPGDPQERFLSWIVLEESDSERWTCGGVDISEHVLPCQTMVYLPDVIRTEGLTALYTRRMCEAFRRALPPTEKRQVAVSVMFQEFAEDTWNKAVQNWDKAGLAFFITWLSPPGDAHKRTGPTNGRPRWRSGIASTT